MLPFDIEVTRYLPTPPERHSAFAHLAKAKPAVVPASKSSGNAPKSAGEIKPKAAAPDPATKPARPAEPAPAASVPYDFSHLQRATMKPASRDRSTFRLEDTKLTTSENPRPSPAEARAHDFAIEMERVQAQVEGRKPRQLVDDGPQQASQAFDADVMIAVLRRRDASRAARRSDRIG